MCELVDMRWVLQNPSTRPPDITTPSTNCFGTMIKRKTLVQRLKYQLVVRISIDNNTNAVGGGCFHHNNITQSRPKIVANHLVQIIKLWSHQSRLNCVSSSSSKMGGEGLVPVFIGICSTCAWLVEIFFLTSAQDEYRPQVGRAHDRRKQNLGGMINQRGPNRKGRWREVRISVKKICREIERD